MDLVDVLVTMMYSRTRRSCPNTLGAVVESVWKAVVPHRYRQLMPLRALRREARAQGGAGSRRRIGRRIARAVGVAVVAFAEWCGLVWCGSWDMR